MTYPLHIGNVLDLGNLLDIWIISVIMQLSNITNISNIYNNLWYRDLITLDTPEDLTGFPEPSGFHLNPNFLCGVP